MADGAADAFFIAGGQSLMQALKARLVQPHALVDLQDVAELKGVSVRRRRQDRRHDPLRRPCGRDAPGTGAMQALIDAAAHVGDRQVRNRGTIGGSICWNYIAACMPAVALTLDATIEPGLGQRRSTQPAGSRVHRRAARDRAQGRRASGLAPAARAAGACRQRVPEMGAGQRRPAGDRRLRVYVELDGRELLAGAGRLSAAWRAGPGARRQRRRSWSGARSATMRRFRRGHGGGGRRSSRPRATCGPTRPIARS